MEVLTPIVVNVILAIVGVVLTAVLVMLRAYLKDKLTKEQFEFLDTLADAAVWAIEQKGPGVFSSKKEAAGDIIRRTLTEKGIDLPQATIDAAIESNVGRTFNYRRLVREEEQA